MLVDQVKILTCWLSKQKNPYWLALFTALGLACMSADVQTYSLCGMTYKQLLIRGSICTIQTAFCFHSSEIQNL